MTDITSHQDGPPTNPDSIQQRPTTGQEGLPSPAAAPAGGSAGSLADIVRPEVAITTVKFVGLSYAVVWTFSFLGQVLLRLDGDLREAVGVVSPFTGAFQAVAMAFFAPLRMSVDQFGATGSLSLAAPIVSVTVVATGMVLWLSGRAERAQPSKDSREQLAVSVLTGAGFAAMTIVLAAVFKLAPNGSTEVARLLDLAVILKFSAASVLGFMLVTASVSAVAFAARWAIRTPKLGLLADQVRALGLHMLGYSAVLVALAVCALTVEEGLSWIPTGAATVVLGLGNLLLYGVVIGHFGSLDYSFAGGVEMLDLDVASGSVSILSLGDDGASVWLLPVSAAGVMLVTACLLYVRTPDRPKTATQFWYAAAVWAAAGAALTLIGRLQATAAVSGDTGLFGETSGTASASFGPATWSFLLLAVWGVTFELVRQHVAPVVAPSLPAKFRAVARSGMTGSDSAPALPKPSEATSRNVRRGLVGLAGLGALLTGYVLTTWVGNHFVFNAERPVAALVAELENGSTDELLRVVNKQEFSNLSLLDEDVFSGARFEDLSYDVVSSNVEDNNGVVKVRVQAEGRSWMESYSVKKVGKRFGLFDRWVVGHAPVSGVSVDATTVSGVKVNGHALKQSTGYFAVLPGEYTFTAGEDSRYFTVPDSVVTVREGANNRDVSLVRQKTPALAADAEAAAIAFIDNCASSNTSEFPEDACPDSYFRYHYTDEPVEDVTWTISSYPDFDVVPVDEYDPSMGFALVTTVPGQISGVGRIGRERMSTAASWDPTDDIWLGGAITVTGDELTVEWTNDEYYSGWDY